MLSKMGCRWLVVHRVDRLARSISIQEVVLAHAWGLGPHVEVFESNDGLIKRDSSDDSQRRLGRQLLGAVAEFERGLATARLQAGRRHKARVGGYCGGPRLHRRYGYELTASDYRPVAAERDVIDRILYLRRGGATWVAIAQGLNDDAVPPASGAEWYATTVRRIGRREQEALAHA